MKAVVIGGGISGLTAAYRLIEQARRNNVPLEVTVLEASARIGGIIDTEIYKDAVIENGPDSFITTKPAGLALVDELGLRDRLIETNKSFRRAFVALNRKLHPIPEGFVMMAPSQMVPFLASPIFSPAGKARILMDVLIPPKQVEDETLASFVRRRFGKEALDRMAQPMLAGVYTADPERLSLRSTMPQFLNYETKYGSVIVGLQEEARAKSKAAANDGGARYSMFVSLDGGMQVLVDKLVDEIGRSNLRFNSSVTSLKKHDQEFQLSLNDGTTLTADAVVLAVPTHVAAKILATGMGYAFTTLAEHLVSIEYASSVVLNLIYRREDIPDALNGFGFVVPASERRDIIACSYSSIKFANRAPNGMVTLRVFVGGALKPGMVKKSDKELLRIVQRDLRHYLRIEAEPQWHKIARWQQAMPQYHLGHTDLVNRMNHQLEKIPGLSVAGNAYAGVGIPDCINSGNAAGLVAFQHLNAQPAHAQ